MNRRVASLGALVGALVLVVVACTPPPGAAMVDRINFWDVNGERQYTLLVVAPAPSPPPYPVQPAGSIENTSTSSTVVLDGEVFFRQYRTVLTVSCVGPQAPVGAGLSCPAEGTQVAELQTPAETFEGVLSGTLTTSGPSGSVTAVFDGTLSGQPSGIPDNSVAFSLYDGAPSVP